MHLLSRGLAVTQSSSGRFGEDKFVACVGNRTTVHRLSDPGTVPTELSRLMFAFLNGNKNLMKTKRIIPPPLSAPNFRSLVDYVDEDTTVFRLVL